MSPLTRRPQCGTDSGRSVPRCPVSLGGTAPSVAGAPYGSPTGRWSRGRGTGALGPISRPTKGHIVVHPKTDDDRPQALEPARESMTLLVAAVIVHDRTGNRVVLLQRSETAKFARGKWDLPVGKSEPGEPVTETAVRELYEETGLTVRAEALKVAHIIHSAWGVEAPNGFLTVVFAAEEWTGEVENREPRKHAQVRWVDVDAVPEDFVETTGSALRGYLAGGPEVSLDGWS